MSPLKKFLRPALFITAFIVMIICERQCEKEVDRKDSILLNNTVAFGGIVTRVQVSGNHSFGVITLRVADHNLPVFIPAHPTKKEKRFPYKLQHDIGEVYDLVPLGLAVGDSVYVNSKERMVKYFITKENQQVEGRLSMIRSELDIDFVHENSKIK